MHESRSAALKGLYPNYPSPSIGSIKTPKEGGLRGEPFKKKDKERERERERDRDREKDRDRERDRDGAESNRQRSDSHSVADNGTWDTNSTLSSLETNTQYSVN
jgi:Ni/Co efflux regulator RcnB